MLAVAHVLGTMMALFAVTFVLPLVSALIYQDGTFDDFAKAIKRAASVYSSSHGDKTEILSTVIDKDILTAAIQTITDVVEVIVNASSMDEYKSLSVEECYCRTGWATEVKYRTPHRAQSNSTGNNNSKKKLAAVTNDLELVSL